MTTEPDTPSDPDAHPDPGPSIEDLQEAILGGVPELDGNAVADLAGVDLESAGRLWRALGFPEAGETAAFTRADAEALRLVFETAQESGIDVETMLRVTRGVGQTAARLADWEVTTLGSAFPEFTGAGVSGPEARRRAMDLIEDMVPRFDALLIHAWRRHLAAAVARIALLVGDREEEESQVSVGFADMVGFSELSNELDDHALGALVELFETRCADILTEHDARLIKTLGDSVLFLHADPAVALDIAWDIIERVGRDDHLPDVRVGVATGPVVWRMGDVFGPPVNLAARLTTVARRNRVITDLRTQELLPEDRFTTRAIPARPMRGFGDVIPVTVRRARPQR